MNSSSSIQPLPPEVVAQIKSSVAITHLSGVVIELFKNSLDSGAQNVKISVDFQKGGCTVEDDGSGIPPSEFREGGGLLKLHRKWIFKNWVSVTKLRFYFLDTSKFQAPYEVYGRKGSFLASLAALCLLNITSHHRSDPSTNTITYHHSKAISRLLPAPVQHELDCREHGTKVTVANLFGNLPVRVKHRAISLTKNEDLDKEIDYLKRMVTSILISFTKCVKVSISEVSRNRRLIFRNNSISKDITRSKSDSVGSLDLDHVLKILTHAGYITPRDYESWVTASARTSRFTIQSAISLQPSPSKQVQFISFGIHPVLSQTNANILYTEANQVFSLSKFGSADDHPVLAHGLKDLQLKDQPHADAETIHLKEQSSSKGINKWPMFYIRIDFHGQLTDFCQEEDFSDSNNSLQMIVDVLKAMLSQFLEQHNFQPRLKTRGKRTRKPSSLLDCAKGNDSKRLKTNISQKPSTSDLRTGDVGEPKGPQIDLPVLPTTRPKETNYQNRSFETWSRVKSGNKSGYEDLRSGLPRGKNLSNSGMNNEGWEASRDCSSGCSHSSSRVPTPQDRSSGDKMVSSDTRSRIGTPNGPHGHDDMGDSGELPDEVIRWTNPINKEEILINCRTGQTIPATKRTAPLPREPLSARYSPSPSTRKNQPRGESSESEQWFENLLKEWNNPVFHLSEKPIASISHSVLNKPSSVVSHDNHYLHQPFCAFKGRLRKEGLRAAEVISQVDNKFILVKMRVDNVKQEQLLVLVDQHAADERCHVEQLFRRLCSSSASESFSIPTTAISTPLSFSVSEHDARLLEIYRSYFASWGCFYIISSEDGLHNYVTVNKLPTLIAERCRQEPGLVIDMLRSEIWQREDDGRRHTQTNHSVTLDEKLTPKDNDQENEPWSDAASWVELMVDCPKGIIDLLNSRACRSAIMFNDPLSKSDCKNLISRLSSCDFPFQCAHGRPSMVPIVNLGLPDLYKNVPIATTNASVWSDHFLGSTAQAGVGLSFTDAFKAWNTLQ